MCKLDRYCGCGKKLDPNDHAEMYFDRCSTHMLIYAPSHEEAEENDRIEAEYLDACQKHLSNFRDSESK